MFSSTKLFTLFSLAGLVASHGLPGSVKVDGKSYPAANLVGADPANSPIRPVDNAGSPIKDLGSNDMICGANAKAAPVVANAKPGSTIEMNWQPEGLDKGPHWFHLQGPIMTYMASCGDDCTTFKPDGSTKWFKIDEQGYQPGGTIGGNTPWVQAELDDGKPSTVKLPDDLPNGNYLFRQEIITLQVAQAQGGAEYYPSCMQLKVTGGSDGGLPSNTVSFPGAYSATDAGILIDVFTPNGKSYPFPGPQVAKFSGKDAAPAPAPSSSDEPKPASSSAAPAPASSSPAAAPSAPVNVGAAPSSPAASPSPSPASSSSAPAASSTGKCKAKKSKRTAVEAALRKKALSAHKKRRLSTA